MFTKKTKIVCTIGPASWDFEVMKQMTRAGMNVVRVNMSHGTHEEKAEQFKNARKISEELTTQLAVMADLQGPKLRLGDFEGIIEINKGDNVNLSTIAQEGEVPMQFDLSPYVKKGDRIFLNDGLVEIVVTDVIGKLIKTKAQNKGWIVEHKGVNIPDTKLKGAIFSEKDINDANFALKENVDFLAISFIQEASDLKKMREILKQHKSKAKIIVKIETKGAVENLEEIIKASDAVMVARGDMALEIGAANVPIVQQKITRLGRQYQKPVIVATQMLESMVENPRPTRAEASDVANAVLDQVDAVMLSAETTIGKYPVDAVKTMTEIINAVENEQIISKLESYAYKNYIKIDWSNMSKEEVSANSIASSAASIAYRTDAKAIVVGTAGGKTVRAVSSFRPSSQIVAFTHEEQICNQLSLIWGVQPFMIRPTQHLETFVKNIVEAFKQTEFAKKGDKIVIVTGSKIGVAGTTDTIKLASI